MNVQTVRAATARPPFGGLLKRWREARGASQLELALSSGVSQRHVSYLEVGRARPSRDMVLHLASTLAVPLREQNDLLLAAGFAPVYRETPLADPLLAQATQALDLLLDKQEPYPALVLDRHWVLRRSNRAGQRLAGFLLDLKGPPPADAPPLNLMRAMFDPGSIRPHVENWPEVAAWALRRLQAELVAEGRRAAEDALWQALLDYPGAREALKAQAPDNALGQPQPPLITARFRKDGVRLGFFSMMTMLGTPQDVTLQELRVESFFPADEATEAWLRAGA